MDGVPNLLCFVRLLSTQSSENQWLEMVKLRNYMREMAGRYDSITEARRELGAYFDFYNHRRRHQGLEDRTPDEVYRSALWTEQTAE